MPAEQLLVDNVSASPPEQKGTGDSKTTDLVATVIVSDTTWSHPWRDRRTDPEQRKHMHRILLLGWGPPPTSHLS